MEEKAFKNKGIVQPKTKICHLLHLMPVETLHSLGNMDINTSILDPQRNGLTTKQLYYTARALWRNLKATFYTYVRTTKTLLT